MIRKTDCSVVRHYTYVRRWTPIRCMFGRTVAAANRRSDTELKLYEAILHGEPWAVFCLRIKGRYRGYRDKAEVEVTGVTLQIVEKIVDVPDEDQPQGGRVAPGQT